MTQIQEPNNHITSFLSEYYIHTEKPLDYAVLLNGSWGAGKTWFIKDFLKKNNDDDKFLYVSLYGIE